MVGIGTAAVSRDLETSAPAGGRAGRILFIGLVILAALFGLLLRLWALGRAPINADEAVVGLMAREILHGHFFAFYWGQYYGGAEPYVVAVLSAIFGQSSLTLGMTPVLLDAIASLLVWRLATRLFGGPVGVGAALVVWLWPEFFLWQSTIEYGFRFVTLDCGLAVLLIAIRVTDPRATRWKNLDWISLGFFAGLGWWASPEVVYYLVPAAALLGYHIYRGRLRLAPRQVLIAAAALVLGALPWIWSNLASGFKSFQHGPQPNPGGDPFIEHLRVFIGHALPITLGLRLRVSGAWLFDPPLAKACYVAVLVLGLALLVDLVRRRQALVLVGFVVFFPIAYAISPFTWYWADGRYIIYLVPIEAILLVAGMARLVELLPGKIGSLRSVLGPILAIAVGIALTLGAVGRLDPYRPVKLVAAGRSSWFSWRSDPSGYYAGLAALLENDGVHDLFAGYWVAYPLAFESRGSIVATDPRYVRYQPYLTTVDSNSKTAWLFVRPARSRVASVLTGSPLLDPGCAVIGDRCLVAGQLTAFLSAEHVGFRSIVSGDFEVVEPARPVPAVTLLRHFHIEP